MKLLQKMHSLSAVLLSLLIVSTPVSSFAQSASDAALSTSDDNAVNSWIAERVAANQQPFCYRQSYGRGVGTPLSTCPSGTAKNGLIGRWPNTAWLWPAWAAIRTAKATARPAGSPSGAAPSNSKPCSKLWPPFRPQRTKNYVGKLKRGGVGCFAVDCHRAVTRSAARLPRSAAATPCPTPPPQSA